jgi:hypothetical protein
MEKERDCSR